MIIPFTKEDLEYFDYCLGKKATPKELNILEEILFTEKLKRYFCINRNKSQEGLIIKKKGIISYTTDGKLNYKNDSSILQFSCNGQQPYWIVYSFLFKPSAKIFKDIQETLIHRLKPFNIQKIIFEIPHNAKRRMNGEIEVEAFIKDDNKKFVFNPNDQILSIQLPNSKKSISNEKQLGQLINILKSDGLLTQCYYSDNNIGQLVFKFIQNKNTGLTVHEGIIKVSKKYAFLVVPKKYIKKVTDHFTESKYKVELFGHFNDDPYLHYFRGKSTLIKLPKSMFSLQSSSTSRDMAKENYNLKTQKIPTIGKKRLKQIYSKFSNHIKKERNKTIDYTLKNETETILATTHILKPFTNDLYLKYIYTFLGIQVSNAITLKHMCIDILFTPDCNIGEFQKFFKIVSEILLSLNIKYTCNIKFTESISEMLISCLAKPNTNLHKNNSLSNTTNYFISVVGVLKGQLINSKITEWLELNQFKNSKAPLPLIEINSYNAIKYCLQENIIEKSAPMINGGLAIALENLIKPTNHAFGAKVFISRKMKPIELIYGEQYGTFLVILNEKNLMEFQRICMKHNAPCSTIGRVINTSQIIINEYINVTL